MGYQAAHSAMSEDADCHRRPAIDADLWQLSTEENRGRDDGRATLRTE
jgi:hypothetical protein